MSTEFRFRYIASNLKLLVVSTAFVVAACNDVGRPDTVVDPSTVDDPSEPVDETDSSDVTDVSDVTEPAIESDESDVTDPADASEVEEPVLTFRVLSPETRTSYELGIRFGSNLKLREAMVIFRPILWSRSLISMAPWEAPPPLPRRL